MLKGELGGGSQALCIQPSVQLSKFPAMTVRFESSTGEKEVGFVVVLHVLVSIDLIL